MVTILVSRLKTDIILMTNSSHIGAQLRVVGVGDSQLGTRTSHRIAPQEAESGQELEAGAVAGRSDGDGLLELLPRRQLPASDHVPAGTLYTGNQL